ncbi:MAG: InlB B-repeat-containing protein, partial [bacterium]
GAGDPFIRSSSADINDATVSKHNVNGTTGLLVLASDEINRYYYHNYIALPSNGLATISSFSPAQGPAGTLVTITGANFNGVSSVKFNGTAATNFTINSNTQITATVPSGATTGKISVTKTTGTAMSGNAFTVTAPTQYALTVNVAGSGSVNPSGGLYNAGTMVTLTATPNAGFQFSGWSGDLSGTTNPATITMDGNKNVTATFAPSNAGGTQVAFEEAKTGSISKSTIVATSANLTGASGQLYLAAISTKDNIAVTGVAGLGLNWTLLKAQCAGRNNTGVEVWMAQGTPSGNGAVTATFAARASDAVIAVSRYSGVAAVNPLGNIFSSNTNGLNGACSGGNDNKLYSFNLATATNG